MKLERRASVRERRAGGDSWRFLAGLALFQCAASSADAAAGGEHAQGLTELHSPKPLATEFGAQTSLSGGSVYPVVGLVPPDAPQQKGSDEGAVTSVVTAPPARPTYNQPQLPAVTRNVPELDWENSQPIAVPEALLKAIEIVTRQDPSVRAAWLDARAASASVRSARWLSYPALTGGVNVSNDRNHVLPTLTVDMPIWAGGRIKSAVRRARHAESAAVAKWQETVLALALQVNDTYFAVVQSTSLEKLYRESLSEHQRLVHTMERRVDQEVSPLADLELARSRAAQIEQELAFITSQRDSALQSLAQLVQDPNYDLGPSPVYNPARLTVDWKDAVEAAVEYSPTRWRLTYEAQAARDQVSQARAALFPRVSAQYSYNEITGSRVGVGLQMQTTNGLGLFSDISAAQSRQESAENQIRLFERQLRQDIANEVVSHEAALVRAEVSQRARETAGNVSESYVRQFIAGRRSWLDVMNSLREYLTAQSSLLQAQVTAMSTSVRLNIRTGRWDPAPAAEEQ